MRTTKHIRSKQIIELRKHMALLKMVLHFVNAIYYKLGNDYCKAIKNLVDLAVHQIFYVPDAENVDPNPGPPRPCAFRPGPFFAAALPRLCRARQMNFMPGKICRSA